MEKVIAAILSGVMVLSMAACSPSSSSGSESSSSKKSSAKIVSNSKETEDKNEKESSKDATIEETVLVNESGIKITATKLSYDGIFGPELGLLIENDSGQDLTFQTRNESVNGYMVDTMFSPDVLNGKKANDTITFQRSELEECGISTIADMEFSFHIFTADEWDSYLDTPPIQLKTSAADTYQYKFDDSGDVLYDGSGVKIVSKGIDLNDSVLGPRIVMYIENNTDKDITVQTRDESVNGFMVDTIFSPELNAGKRAVSSITLSGSGLEQNGISNIETVELSFHIFESSGMETIADTDMITLNF